MARTITAAMKTAMQADKITPAHLFEFRFDAGTIYNTDSYRDISWGGNTYLGNGHLANFSAIEETATLIIHQARFSLSGVDQSWVSTVLSYDFLDREALVYLALLDTDTTTPIADPFLIFRGRMDNPSIADDPPELSAPGTTTVTVEASSDWADFGRAAGRHTNHEDQQIFFPGDLGFDMAAAEMFTPVQWYDHAKLQSYWADIIRPVYVASLNRGDEYAGNSPRNTEYNYSGISLVDKITGAVTR